MRVLITASREWHRRDVIWGYLDVVYGWWLDQDPGPGDEFIVVHGDARGGDTDARDWAIDKHRQDPRVDHQAYPADWDAFCPRCNHHRVHRGDGSSYCPVAGHIRNGVMVKSGINLCMGFPLDGPGTRGCLKLAKAADVLTYRYRDGRMSRV